MNLQSGALSTQLSCAGTTTPSPLPSKANFPSSFPLTEVNLSVLGVGHNTECHWLREIMQTRPRFEPSLVISSGNSQVKF